MVLFFGVECNLLCICMNIGTLYFCSQVMKHRNMHCISLIATYYTCLHRYILHLITRTFAFFVTWQKPHDKKTHHNHHPPFQAIGFLPLLCFSFNDEQVQVLPDPKATTNLLWTLEEPPTRILRSSWGVNIHQRATKTSNWLPLHSGIFKLPGIFFFFSSCFGKCCEKWLQGRYKGRIGGKEMLEGGKYWREVVRGESGEND